LPLFALIIKCLKNLFRSSGIANHQQNSETRAVRVDKVVDINPDS